MIKLKNIDEKNVISTTMKKQITFNLLNQS